MDLLFNIDPRLMENLKNIESLRITLEDAKDDDIKYITIKKENGECKFELETQNYAIQKSTDMRRKQNVLQKLIEKRYANLPSEDQRLVLKILNGK